MLRKLRKLYNKAKIKSSPTSPNSPNDASTSAEEIPKSIDKVHKKLKETFEGCSDFVLREITLGSESGIDIIVAYMDGLVNKQSINNDLLKPLMIDSHIANFDVNTSRHNVLDMFKKILVPMGEFNENNDFQSALNSILSGDTAIFIGGQKTCLIACTKGWESRNVDEPSTENVVRGPREGFVESLRTNTALLRRKIKNADLKFEMIKLGEKTQTDICLCYLKGIAHEDTIDTVRRRIKNIQVDGVLESGYVEQFIEDAPLSLFPTVGNSERPDKIAGKILEGRIAIIVDGSPIVLTVPFLFIEMIQVSEDYYKRFYHASFIRLIRVLAILIAGIVPAFYVALLAFHTDVVPIKLLLSIAASREGIPFSPFYEALFMGIVFELLKEAGVRMPKTVGQAVNIVGALVIGEAAVRAGLVSNIMVIIVALTGIASFIIPPLEEMLPIFRMILLLAANALGFLGISFVLIAFLIHLCTLRSFGVPYTYPFSPLVVSDLKDTLIRLPLWLLRTRPKALTWGQNLETKYRMTETTIKKED